MWARPRISQIQRHIWFFWNDILSEQMWKEKPTLHLIFFLLDQWDKNYKLETLT